MSMITASLWIPRGAAAAFPTKYDVDDGELERISKLAKLQLDEAKEDLYQSKASAHIETEDEDSDVEEDGVVRSKSQIVTDDDLKEYDLEHYDSDAAASEGEHMPMFGNTRSLAYHESNAEDPYITMQESGEDDEERNELQIVATDNMVVAAKVEDEVPYLEVYVYEDEADNLYVHHDIMLPAIPLCVEWLDLPVGKDANTIDEDSRGNYVAVGTMDPDIELWDLDVIDSMYPNAVLGQGAPDHPQELGPKLKKTKKRKKSRKANDEYHVDAVLALASNRQHRNLLASSSADKTIKLWDLNTTKCAKSYSYHTDKVCSIAWHPRESTALLSGSYDRTVVAADMRTPEVKGPAWGVESDVETVMWDPHSPSYFYATTENGMLHMNDIRNAPDKPETSKAVWTLQAHDQALSSMDANSVIPGFLVTGSSDKEVKLWNVQPTGPSMIVSRNVGVGKVFSTKFAPDSEVAFRLAVAGSRGALQVWDTSTNAGVRRAFESRIGSMNTDSKEERIIGIREDSSDDEEKGGPEPGGYDEIAKNGCHSMDDDDNDLS
ncbi:MAG: hypothetical protein Q9163_004990 [Psora crenata]